MGSLGAATVVPDDADVGLLTPGSAGTAVARATGDRAWLRAMLDAEAGLARAQAELGVVPRSAAEAIARVAEGADLDVAQLAVDARGAANPVVALVGALTARVHALDPAAAAHVHRGATSQDIFDTASMLVASRALPLILDDVERAASGLERLAVEHRDTVMAGRTLAMHAVPTTFGLKAAGWLDAVGDAQARLRGIATRLPVQLGGAGGTLAAYVEHARTGGPDAPAPVEHAAALLRAYADVLGLRAPALPWHAQRAPVAELGAALALLTGALGKIAVDVLTLSRTELGEVAEPAAAGRGTSSAMPHKRNPVLATLIRTAALQVPALAAVLLQSMLAEDERPAGPWHAEWQPLRECLRQAAAAAAATAELTQGLHVDAARMRENLDRSAGSVTSERLVALLEPVLGKADAKELLGRASRTAAASGQGLADVVAADQRLAGVMDAERLRALLDPAAYTGAAGLLVDAALARRREGRRR